jgi:2-iminobutanoate/2-iminopropanoate deaminase
MSLTRQSVLLLALLTTGCVATTTEQASAPVEPERQYINPRTPSDSELPPFSGAVRVGNTLYLSGDIGIDENQRVPDTAEAEARLVLTKIKTTIEQAGMTMDDLVSVQVFCSDVAHYAAFNAVYRTFFTREFPARAFYGVGGPLLFNARFEVQGIAVKR